MTRSLNDYSCPSLALDVDSVRLTRSRQTILEDIRFRLEPGMTALLGPNGVGKSTLLRAIASLDGPAAGTIRLNGRFGSEDSNSRSYRSNIGYLPQDPAFIARFTVLEALTYAAWLHRAGDSELSVKQVLSDLRLEAEASTRLSRLSGGTRRRAMLGMTLVHQPEVVLLDEPTVGMDAEHRHAFRLALEAIRPSRIILVSTHTFADLGPGCDRILVLGGRSIVFDGTPDELNALGETLGPDEDSVLEVPMDRAVRHLAAQ